MEGVLTHTSARPVAAPRWGWPEIVGGWVAANVLALLFSQIVIAAGDLPSDATLDDFTIAQTVIVQFGQWIPYLVVALVLTSLRGNGPVVDLGLRTRPSDVPIGLVIGVACQFVLVPVVTQPILWLTDRDIDDVEEAARTLVDKVDTPSETAMLLFMVAVMAPLVEELFYRGMIQRTLLRTLPAPAAVGITAVVFGAVHLQLLAFGALAAFGLVLGVLALRTDRLGLALWAHVGFNATTAIVLLSG